MKNKEQFRIKNLKIAPRLIVSFLLVALFTLILGISGIVSSTILSSEVESMYDEPVIAINAVSVIRGRFNRIHFNALELARRGDNPADVALYKENIVLCDEDIQNAAADYESSVSNMSREVAYKEFQRLYPEYLANIDKVAVIAKTSGSEAAIIEFEKHNGLADDVINAIEDMASYNVEVAADLNEQADAVSLTVLFIQITVIAIAIISAIVIAKKTANDISKPVKFVTDFLREIGKGRTIFTEAEIAEQQRISEGKDEMAECVRYLRNVTDALNGIAGLFARIVDDPAILYLPHRSPMSNSAYDKFFPGWKEYYGYNEEMDERIRLHWRGIFENADEIIEQVIKVRETHEKQELLWRFKNGTKLEFKATIVDFDDGNFGELWLARDVTAIYDLMQKANDASLAKSMFLSSMSHEIRTPMNAIIGMTSLARKTKDLDRISVYLEKTEEAGHRLMSLINDVLDMSKIESGKLQIVKQEFDFEKMLNHAVSVISDKAVEKQIDVKVVHFTPITRLVYGDELRISQVIVNLLSNAVKFTPDNGKIVITTEIHKDNHLYVCCTDTGIGISKEALEKLFHSFEQADNSITRRYGGTGLGLAISKQIVELMGGEISVESTVGEGSKFTFSIPIELRGEIINESENEQNSGSDSNAVFKDKHILLVEDVEINRMIVAGLLEDSGCIIDEAENGEAAVYMAGKNTYDLILMDVSMPVMDGLTATKNIRKFNPDIPIIAMTANAFKEDAEACIKAGMNAHLAKPIEPKDFMEVLTDWLKNTSKI